MDPSGPESAIRQEGDGDFVSVSDKLLGTLVKKKNLKAATRYTTRVRSRPLPKTLLQRVDGLFSS